MPYNRNMRVYVGSSVITVVKGDRNLSIAKKFQKVPLKLSIAKNFQKVPLKLKQIEMNFVNQILVFFTFKKKPIKAIS